MGQNNVFQSKSPVKKELDVLYFSILSTTCECAEPKHPKLILESTLFTYLRNGYADAVFFLNFFLNLKENGSQKSNFHCL